MTDAGSAEGAPLFLRGTSPDASADALIQLPREARRSHRAASANPSKISDQRTLGNN